MHNQHSTVQVYICPMHPEVEKNEEGTCPHCGMDLVPKETDEE